MEAIHTQQQNAAAPQPSGPEILSVQPPEVSLTTAPDDQFSADSIETIPIPGISQTSAFAKKKKAAHELTLEQCDDIFEESSNSTSNIQRLLQENMANSCNSSFKKMMTSIQHAVLPQKTVKWVIEQVAQFNNNKCQAQDGVKMDDQKLERRTILLGFILLSIIELQEKSYDEIEGSVENFLANLNEKALLREGIKLSTHLEKMIRRNEIEEGPVKNEKESLFDQIVEKFSQENDKTRIEMVIELEDKGGPKMMIDMIKNKKKIDTAQDVTTNLYNSELARTENSTLSNKPYEFEMDNPLSNPKKPLEIEQDQMKQKACLTESPIDNEGVKKNDVRSKNEGQDEILEVFVFETPKIEKQLDENQEIVNKVDQKMEIASIVSFCPDGEIDGNEPNRERNLLNAEEEQQTLNSTADTSNIYAIEGQSEHQSDPHGSIVPLPEEEEFEETPTFEINENIVCRKDPQLDKDEENFCVPLVILPELDEDPAIFSSEETTSHLIEHIDPKFENKINAPEDDKLPDIE